MEVLKPLKSCPDVMDCLREDHESVQSAIDHLRTEGMEVGRKRAIFKRILPLYQAHTHGKEASVLEEGIQVDALRPAVRNALECHEAADFLLEKVRLAVDDEQWEARVHVFCDLLNIQLRREKETVFPAMTQSFSDADRELLGRRYLEARNQSRIAPYLTIAGAKPLTLAEKQQIQEDERSKGSVLNETGKVGFVVAWLLGVPAWILLLVFLIHG